MRILFFPSTNPSVKTMADLAVWLDSRGCECAMVTNVAQRRFLEQIGQNTINTIDFKTLRPVPIEKSSFAVKPTFNRNQQCINGDKIKAVIQRLHHSSNSISIILLSVYWLLQVLRFRWMWRDSITDLKADFAFVWGDSAGGTNGEFLDQLKSNGTKLVHLPVSLTDQKIIHRLRVVADVQQLGPHSSMAARILGWLFPNQLFQYEGRTVFYYHPSEILAMALLGGLPSKPWVQGGSRADYVCLASTYERDYWIKRGLNSAKIDVIGNLDLQNVNQQVKRLRGAYPSLFKKQQPLVLVNMPNLIEHGVLNDWMIFWDHVRMIMSPFTDRQVELVACLHPKAELSNYERLADDYGCFVVQGDIAAWIHLADLYVSACSTSEVIANYFGIQVLDFGKIYHFESDVLNMLPAISFCNNYDDYAESVNSHLFAMHGIPRRFKELDDALLAAIASPFQTLANLEWFKRHRN